MKTACFIPIKANSERVPGKNFRVLNGKKLYQYICEHAKSADVFDDIYIDTNSDEIAEYAQSNGLKVIERVPSLAQNTANGNDLLVHHLETFPDYDYYFQLFATAPYLQPETISFCFDKLISSVEFDSCFTATENHGFYWLSGTPIIIARGFFRAARICCLLLKRQPVYMGFVNLLLSAIAAGLVVNRTFILSVNLRRLILIRKRI